MSGVILVSKAKKESFIKMLIQRLLTQLCGIKIPFHSFLLKIPLFTIKPIPVKTPAYMPLNILFHILKCHIKTVKYDANCSCFMLILKHLPNARSCRCNRIMGNETKVSQPKIQSAHFYGILQCLFLTIYLCQSLLLYFYSCAS